MDQFVLMSPMAMLIKVFWQHVYQDAISKKHALYKKRKKQASCSHHLGKIEAAWEKRSYLLKEMSGQGGDGI